MQLVNILKRLFSLIFSYPAPSNLNYNYNFGVYVEDTTIMYSVNEISTYTFPFSIFLIFLIFFFTLYIIFYNFSIIKSIVNLFTYKVFLMFFIPILILSFCSLYIPLVTFFFVLIITCVSGFLSFQPLIHHYTGLSKDTVYYLLKFLEQIHIIPFFVELYCLVFIGSMEKFRRIFWIVNVLAVLYALLTRWYFYNTVIMKIAFNSYLLVLIYLALVISLMAVYFRFLASFSLTFIPACKAYPDIAPDLLALTIEPEVPASGSKTSLISFDKNTHHHHYPIPPSVKVPIWRNGILWTAIATLSIGSVTAFYTYRQAVSAGEQAISAREQTWELTRQNDLEEVSQNLMTAEEYNAKWKPIRSITSGPIATPTSTATPTAPERHFPNAFNKK